MRTSVRGSALLFAGAVACGACAGPDLDPVEVDEGGVLSFDVRAVLPFGDQTRRHALAEGRPEEAVGTLGGVVFGFDYVEDDGDQTLLAGETIELDEDQFSGPAQVDYDYRVTGFSLLGQGGHVFEEGLMAGFLAGLSSHTFQLIGRSGGIRDSVDVFSLGLALGGELVWYSPARVHAFTRLLATFEVADERESVGTNAFELGLGYHFSRWFHLGAGWRWFAYDAEGNSSVESDIELDLDGPFVTLGFSP